MLLTTSLVPDSGSTGHQSVKNIKKKKNFKLKTALPGTSLVVQGLRVHLPTRETQVTSLVREDPTCWGATKPVHPRVNAPQQETLLQWEAHAPQLESSLCSSQL